MKTKQSLFRVLFLGPALLETCIGQTAEYYVSPTGDDASNGSQDSPFATVAKGVSRLQAGDTLYLREGDHYISSPIEMYTIKGTPEKPITIRNYPNEKPILKGCRPIGTDGWVCVTEEDRNYQAFFKRAPNGVTPAELQNIYKKRIEFNIFDLYMDNEGQTLARWPNGRDWGPEAWDQWKSRRGVTDRQTHTRIYDHEAQPFPGGKLSDLEVNLTGCGVAGGLSGFRDARTVITAHVPGQDYFDHEYIPRITGKDGEKHWSVIRYYLLGLPLLDEEMEWGFDMDEDGEGGTVYVWTKDDNYFIPGRREVNASHPIPPNGTGTAKPDCDLMWRPARDGQTCHVYFGRSRNDLALMNSQTNNIYDPGMLTYGQEYFWRVDTVTSASPNPIPGDVWSFTVEPAFGNVTMEAGTIAVDAQWRTVSLANKYLNPVVVCTVQLNANIHPVVARVRNARAHSFDLCLQNSSGKPVTDDAVHYLVVEEGSHRLPNGAGVEARLITFESEAGTETRGKRVDFNVNFSRPVVFAQVMTCNDPVCSVSWNRFQDLPWWHSSALMDSRYCYVGYHAGRNTGGAVNGETLGVIILEAGMGEIGGVKYEINRKDDKAAGIRGVMDKDAPYGTKLVNFDKTPRWGIATRTGMEHPADEQGEPDDFSWAVLHGESPLTVDRIQLSLDEFDGCDRKVTDGKKFSYFVLENSLRFDGTAPSNQRFPRRATSPPAQEE